MPSFSSRSQAELDTCHEDLHRLFSEVVKFYDCTVLEGRRSVAKQHENVAKGVSKTLNSKHIPKEGQLAKAADVSPYPVKWPDQQPSPKLKLAAVKRFVHFAGYVQRVADELNIKIRWGGDWDSDGDFSDQSFHDLPHFELV